MLHSKQYPSLLPRSIPTGFGLKSRYTLRIFDLSQEYGTSFLFFKFSFTSLIKMANQLNVCDAISSVTTAEFNIDDNLFV